MRVAFRLLLILPVTLGLLPSIPSLRLSLLSERNRKSALAAQETNQEPPEQWQTLHQVATVSSPWLTVYCERLRDDQGQTLDYWRVEKDHSVIVLTIQRNRLIFPKKQYRPGVGKQTLDFAGGRASSTPQKSIAGILKRELNLDVEKDVEKLEALNESAGWLINSSFSNQELFGYVAKIRDDVELDPELLHSKSYAVDDMVDIDKLLEKLTCLQCRSVMMEWLMRQSRLGIV
jgi:hypothetical protein